MIGSLLLVTLSLATVGCSGGNGGAVLVVPPSETLARFAGYLGGITLPGTQLMLVPASADLNGDGFPDVVASGFDPFFSGGGSLVVLLSTGAGQFAEPVEISLPEAFPFFPVLADFDGDGDVDIAVNDAGAGVGADVVLPAGRILVLLNDGQGAFGPPSNVLVDGASPFGLAAGDFDGDGDLDLATANNDSGDVSVVLGNGDGTFGASAQYDTGFECNFDLRTGDLTGDGDLDLAVSDECGDQVAILEGNGDGTFQGQEITVALTPRSSQGPRFRDTLQALRDNPPNLRDREHLNLLTLLPTTAESEFITLADFNSDGHLDLATAIPNPVQDAGRGGTTGVVDVILGLGGGTFGDTMSYPMTGFAPLGLTHGDFDGDGVLDLACTNIDSAEVSILKGDGTGAFTEIGLVAVGSGPVGVLAADLDGDGHLDLLSANEYFANLTYLRGHGDGTFQATPRYFTGQNSFDNPVAVGDLDGDGLDDAVMGFGDHNEVAVFLNQGAGTFGTPQFYPCLDSLFDVALGDLDGDGFPDLVGSAQSTTDLVVLINDGLGGFSAPTSFDVAAAPDQVTLADFTGDGNLDAAVAVANENAVALFPGDGQGGFGAFSDFDSGVDGWALTAADLDGDGSVDLAVAGAGGLMPEGVQQGNRFSVLLNDGDGNFTEPAFYDLTDEFSEAVAAGDFDGDGFPDLVVAGSRETQDGSFFIEGVYSLLLNNGDGTFGAATEDQVGILPSDLQVADVDGDGDVDLVSADPLVNSVLVAWGNGDGTLGDLAGWNAWGGSFHCPLGNFNGDAFPDIALSLTPDGSVPLRTGAQQVGNDHSAALGILNSIVR